MSIPTPPATPPATPEDDQAYYRQILHGLIDIGADLAQRLHKQATSEAPNPDAPAPDLEAITTAFDRTARAVRRTIALATHLAANPTARTAETRAAARRRIIRDVEDAILHKQRLRASDGQPGRERTTDLYAELSERLDAPELDRDLATRPISEIIEELCRDLGVAVQGRSYIHKRRRPHEVAALNARAEAPPKVSHLHLVPPTTRKRE